MASIIAAFSKPQDAGNIRAILRKNGYEPVFACTSGAQVLAAAESLNGGIAASALKIWSARSCAACSHPPLICFSLLPRQNGANGIRRE